VAANSPSIPRGEFKIDQLCKPSSGSAKESVFKAGWAKAVGNVFVTLERR
jgi:hypothetical protein